MSHDFGTTHGGTGRYWDSTNECNNQGIMSYGNWDLAKWSTCSVADFKQHYQEEGWGNGCLDDLGESEGGDATTEPPLPTCSVRILCNKKNIGLIIGE